MPHTITRLDSSSENYPPPQRFGGAAADFPSIHCIGDPALLARPLLGLLCSQRCPGEAILRAYDLARALRDAHVPTIGGFHSPMERECLDLLLRGRQPLLICPARNIDRLRVPVPWRAPLDTGRLLIASPFPTQTTRVTADSAQRRNRFVAALATEVLILHADAGSRTEHLALDLLRTRRTVLVLHPPADSQLTAHGASAVTIADVLARWNTARL